MQGRPVGLPCRINEQTLCFIRNLYCNRRTVSLSCRPSSVKPDGQGEIPRLKQGIKNGEVSEWLKEHAWKVCIRQRIEGSNPSLTAIL